MGELYESMGKGEMSNQCFKCSKRILDELFGDKSPYDEIGDINKMIRS